MREINHNNDISEYKKPSDTPSSEPVRPTEDDKKKLSTESVRKNLYDEDSLKEGWKKEADEYRAKMHEDPRYQNMPEAEREIVDKRIEDRANWIENGRRGEYQSGYEKASGVNDGENEENHMSRAKIKTRDEDER